MDLSNEIWTIQELTEELQMENDRADRRQQEQTERQRRRLAAEDYMHDVVRNAIYEKLDVVALVDAIKEAKLYEGFNARELQHIGRLILDAVIEWENPEE